MTSLQSRQICRSFRTQASRREAAALRTREARRAYMRAVRLMAEAFGVGEPAPRLVVVFYRGRREVFSL